MEDFRFVVNEAVRLGIQHNITSRFKLRSLVYHTYNKTMYSGYVYTAIFKASAMLKNYRRIKKTKYGAKKPFMKKHLLVIDNQRYTILHNHIKFPIRPHQFVCIPLNHHVSQVLSQPNIKLGEITLTPERICISYSIDKARKEPQGYLAMDMNLDNATCCDENGKISVINTSHLVEMKMKCRNSLSHFTRNDIRIQKKLKQKYGRKQKNREETFLHQKSKEIVSTGKQIIMENLNGMRRLYKKGNGQSKRFRYRLNSWARFKLQRMIDYKSLDNNGFTPVFVRPNGTSSKCAVCGSKLIPEEHRMVRCPTCHDIVDRDVNASKNILARGLVMLGQTRPARFEPDAVQGEVMNQFKDGEQIAPSIRDGISR